MPKSPLHHPYENAAPLFEGRKIDLYVVGKREFVIHPGAVVILPLLSDDEVILIRNERFVVNETLWELPAGTLEPNENPLDAAHRELIEEIGYQANVMDPLFDFYTTPGFCNEKIHAFAAKDLTLVGQNLDPDEKITAEVLKWGKVMTMIKDGTIHDSKTIATLLYYSQFKSHAPSKAL